MIFFSTSDVFIHLPHVDLPPTALWKKKVCCDVILKNFTRSPPFPAKKKVDHSDDVNKKKKFAMRIHTLIKKWEKINSHPTGTVRQLTCWQKKKFRRMTSPTKKKVCYENTHFDPTWGGGIKIGNDGFQSHFSKSWLRLNAYLTTKHT